MLKDKKMKFKIKENGNLSILDDNKETIIHSDRFDLIDLLKTVQSFLIGETKGEPMEKKTDCNYYVFNPRSKRLEKVEE